MCRFSLDFLRNKPWNGVLRARIRLGSALGRTNGQKEDRGIVPQKKAAAGPDPSGALGLEWYFRVVSA